MLGNVDRARCNLRGTEPADREAHRVGHPPRDEFLVVVERLVVSQAADAERAPRGMRVGAGEDDVLRRNPGGFPDETTRLETERTMHPEQVADDDGEPRAPVVEHEAAGVQFVVHLLRRKRSEPADDGRAQRRGDIGLRGARAQRGVRLGRRQCGTKQAGDDKEADRGESRHVRSRRHTIPCTQVGAERPSPPSAVTRGRERRGMYGLSTAPAAAPTDGGAEMHLLPEVQVNRTAAAWARRQSSAALNACSCVIAFSVRFRQSRMNSPKKR